MQKIYKRSGLKKLASAKPKGFPTLRSVSDDATSYKGNQQHYVITFAKAK